MTNLNKNILWK